ncbi:MAG: molybdopterin biosynthesis protein [Chloroflexi bacterium]|nr:molybdopterin biosynthesis protein [Chloroflexota bacterium]
MNDRNTYLIDIPLDEARARLAQALQEAGRDAPLPGETIPLTEALGRVTAEPIWAKLSAPHYHAAAMDGYAVRAEDTRTATETRPLSLQLEEQAKPVNTGDPLPPGMNAVIMIEDVQQPEAGSIVIYHPVAPWQHVRMVGEDMVATELVLPANHKIRPVDIGAIAGCGHHQVKVRRKPLAVIIPTGSELVPADHPPAPGQIIEYNSLVLTAQIRDAGGEAQVTDIIPDDRQRLLETVQFALQRQPDVLLLLSGSSAGSRDFTANIVRELGQLLVHGVAVRPGHPVIMGMIGTTPVIGVPGYPVSAALTGEIFIQPLIARWLGQPSPLEARPRAQAIMTRKLVSPTGDDDFVRVSVAQVGDRLLAAPLSRGAGVITSLVRADGLAHIPRFSEGVDMGQPVNVILYRDLEAIRKTLLAQGSHDPMLDLLAQFVAEQFPGSRLASANVGSLGGLVALRRKEAHFAGVHLLDEATGEYNIAYVEKYLPNETLQLMTFAHREQGLIVPKGNPLNVQGLDDLPRLRYVNRQRGAGTRLLLDYELKQRGIAPEQIAGYEREEYTHLGVAVAVATGIADCGLGVRSAAIALGLDFVPVGWERYDFVFPTEHLAVLQPVISVINTDRFKAALATQPGYNTQDTGRIQFSR